jgi:hypothetical protein
MSIISRIEKLEDKAKGGEFCACSETPKTEIRYPDKSEGDRDTLVPDTCNLCGKPVEKSVIEIIFVESNIPKPEEARNGGNIANEVL